MVFDGVKFNEAWVASKSEAEFIEHEKHTLPAAKLKEVYALIKSKHGNSQKPSGKVEDGGRKSDSPAVDK